MTDSTRHAPSPAEAMTDERLAELRAHIADRVPSRADLPIRFAVELLAEIDRLRAGARLLDWCEANVCGIVTRDSHGGETYHRCQLSRADESFRAFLAFLAARRGPDV